MRAELTTEQKAKALAMKQAGEEWDAIGPTFGMSGNAIRKQVRRAQNAGSIGERDDRGPAAPGEPAPGISWTESRDGATLESGKSATIRTLDDLLAACEVDLSRWTVDRFVVNKWDSVMRGPDDEPVTTELFQVKAWLAPIKGAAAAAELVAGLIAEMREHSPRYEPVDYSRLRAAGADGEPCLLEVCVMDLHAGAYVWGEECGSDYDGDIAADLARSAVAQLVERAKGFPIERIIYPLGNDLAHADKTLAGAGGTTTKGTVVDVDTRRAKMLRTVRTIAVDTIDMLRQIAPVEVLMVKGNHDEDTILALGEIVAAWYRNDDCVTVCNEPTPRKYVRYGATLLGFTHGHNEKHANLPLIMATEAAADWAATTHREFHLGHLHRKGETVSEHSGVRVRVMPSLAAEDAWHCAQGYRHLRAAEAYIWGRDTGYIGHFSASLPGSLGKAA